MQQRHESTPEVGLSAELTTQAAGPAAISPGTYARALPCTAVRVAGGPCVRAVIARHSSCKRPLFARCIAWCTWACGLLTRRGHVPKRHVLCGSVPETESSSSTFCPATRTARHGGRRGEWRNLSIWFGPKLRPATQQSRGYTLSLPAGAHDIGSGSLCPRAARSIPRSFARALFEVWGACAVGHRRAAGAVVSHLFSKKGCLLQARGPTQWP